MTKPRDPEADDLYLDRLLAEQLGGERPRDLAERIVGADPAAMARAAAQVDAAVATEDDRAVVRDRALPAPSPRRLGRFALAATLLLGLAAALVWSMRREPLAGEPTASEQATALLDAFHRVMPVEPPVLRDPVRRQRLAAAAIPVLRDLERFFAAHPQGVPWQARAAEFTIYSLVLADSQTRAEIDAQVRDGVPTAALLTAAAAVITATEPGDRVRALAQVAEHLKAATTEARSAVTCLLTAADLSPAEALRLADAATDEDLAHRLRIGAEIADSSPSRLLGKRFELAGRLHTGAEFSTASLQGKVVLAFFWASWCVPCTQFLPEIVALRDRHTKDGLAVVGISCDQDRRDLSAFLALHPEASWPQLFDEGQPGWHHLAFWSGVRSVPRVFLIDRRGILREIYTRGELERLVRELLAE